MLTIIDAIKREDLFRPYFGDDLSTWKPWMVCLRAVYGLPIRSDASREIIQRVTQRDPDLLPIEGFRTSLFLTGRRSGKSKAASAIGAMEAAFSGREERLSKGEKGIVAIVSPTKDQSKLVKSYLESIFDTPSLRSVVVSRTASAFELVNGVRIEILTGDFRTVRGRTLLAAIIDEVCFFGLDEQSAVRSDTELLRAIKPALMTTGGRLVAISSPYARRGWAHRQWKQHFGNNDSKTLVVNCGSRDLNPLLPQEDIDEAMREDPAAARSEFYGQWRDDVSAFISRPMLEALVVKGRERLKPGEVSNLNAFCDMAGGSGTDEATLAITSRHNRKIVVVLLESWKPPFAPHRVIAEMTAILKRYGIKHVTGDRYSAQFSVDAFRACGVHYIHSTMPRSELYVECLPKLTSGEVELLDIDRLIDQFAALERRTRSGGRDIVDHPPKGHDDLCNSVAGAIAHAVQGRLRVGGFGASQSHPRHSNVFEFQDADEEFYESQIDLFRGRIPVTRTEFKL